MYYGAVPQTKSTVKDNVEPACPLTQWAFIVKAVRTKITRIELVKAVACNSESLNVCEGSVDMSAKEHDLQLF